MPHQRAALHPRYENSAPRLRRRVRDDMNEFLTPEFEAAFEKLKTSLSRDSEERAANERNEERAAMALEITGGTGREAPDPGPNCGNPQLCCYCHTAAEFGARMLFGLRMFQLLYFALRVFARFRYSWFPWCVDWLLFTAFLTEEGLRLYKFGAEVYCQSVFTRLYHALWCEHSRILVGLVAIHIAAISRM